MRKKRRLSFLDIGGIQPIPEIAVEEIPDVEELQLKERMEQLRVRARQILAEAEAEAKAIAEARASRIQAVEFKCLRGEWEKVQQYVKTLGYPTDAIKSGAAYEMAFNVVVGERERQ